MNIQGFQKMTLLDFPGRVACTVFTGGCNLRCPFCHNAGLVRTPMAGANQKDEVLAYLRSRRGILDGVCVTGGEPLLQPDLREFLLEVKAMGFLIKLDTNGSLPARLSETLDIVDYVAMDIKSAPDTYPLLTGSELDVELFKASVELLQNSGIPHEFRTTAVKGLHTVADFEAIARWLPPDSRYFIQRFVDSGNLIGTGCAAFSEDEMQTILQTVRLYIPGAEIRG